VWRAILSDFPFNERWLKEFAVAPIHFADIGGAGGLQGRWKKVIPFIRAYAFEPDTRSFEKLKRTHDNIRYINAALGAQSETRTLHLTRKPQCSSIYEPNSELLAQFHDSERMEVVGKPTVEITTLDILQSGGILPRIDFMKIDVQGFEFDILKGGSRIVESESLGFEIEVEFASIYSGQPLFCDVHGLMRSRDFELLDLRPGYWKRKGPIQGRQAKGQLIYGDALYMRSIAWIASRIVTLGVQEARGLVLRAAALHILYGYYDRAWEILRLRSDLFSSEEQGDIDKAFGPSASILQFFRRAKIYMVLRKVADFFDPGRRGHFTISPQIGNIFEL
jgi:FkbM family methyltransferase